MRRLGWVMAWRLRVAPLAVTGVELMAAVSGLEASENDRIQTYWLAVRNVEAGKTGTHMSRRDFAQFGGKGVAAYGVDAVCGALRGDRDERGFFALGEPPTCAQCAVRWDEAMTAREVIIQKQIAEIQKRFPNWTPSGGMGHEARRRALSIARECT